MKRALDVWTRESSRSLTALAALLLLLWAPASLYPQNHTLGPDTFPSPENKFRVAFRVIEHRTFTAEESLTALDNVDHVEYALTFIHAVDGGTAAEMRYTDVYGFQPSVGPRPLTVIYSWFVWSPEEDFVIMPGEGWASAPGTPERTAISLTDSLAWTQAPITMDTLLWATPLLVVGGQHTDCHYTVEVFDGTTGQNRPLDRPPESPVGYEIYSVEGRTVFVRSILDNCARVEERDRWVSECRAVDLDTFVSRRTPCSR